MPALDIVVNTESDQFVLKNTNEIEWDLGKIKRVFLGVNFLVGK